MKFRSEKIPLEAGTGYGLIPVLLVGKKGEYDALLLLDTGASQSVLSTRLAPALGYHVRELAHEQTPTAGGYQSSWPVSLDEDEVFGSKVKNISIRFMNIPTYDGLLGNDLLRKLNILAVVDVRGRTATIVLRGQLSAH